MNFAVAASIWARLTADNSISWERASEARMTPRARSNVKNGESRRSKSLKIVQRRFRQRGFQNIVGRSLRSKIVLGIHQDRARLLGDRGLVAYRLPAPASPNPHARIAIGTAEV